MTLPGLIAPCRGIEWRWAGVGRDGVEVGRGGEGWME